MGANQGGRQIEALLCARCFDDEIEPVPIARDVIDRGSWRQVVRVVAHVGAADIRHGQPADAVEDAVAAIESATSC